jgi:hypothetical protein
MDITALRAEADPSHVGRADFPWQRTAICHWESGNVELKPQDSSWKLATHTFRGYPAGEAQQIYHPHN